MFIHTTNNTVTIIANERQDDDQWAAVQKVAARLVSDHRDMSVAKLCRFDRSVMLYTSDTSMRSEGLVKRYSNIPK